MDEVLLLVARLAPLAIGGGGAAAIVIATARSGGGRRWLPAAAACALLLGLVGEAVMLLGLPIAALGEPGAVWFVAFPLLAATFPGGVFVPRWSAWFVVFSGIMLALDRLVGGIPDGVWSAFATGQGLVGLAFLAYRYRRSATTPEREAVRWLLLGVMLTASSFALIQIVDGVIGGPEPLAELKTAVAILPLMLGLTIGVARPRLWNIDAVFRAALVVLLAAAALWAVARGLRAAGATWPWATVAVGVAGYPVVRLALAAATWLVYRSRLAPATAVARLATTLDADDPRSAAQRVADVAAEATGSSAVGLRATAPGDSAVFDAEALTGTGEGEASVEGFPIAFRGEVLATLTAAPRAGESTLTARDRETLGAIAHHAAPALHGARALREATEAQAALVTTAAEERRRLRRELHDDLGPALSGLALSAAALERRAGSAAPSLVVELGELYQDIQAAAERSREISHGLRPAVLDDLGLAAAIRDRIGTGQRPRIEYRIDDLGALPAAVDLAALRIVQEAVTNVRRHAGATVCRVAVASRSGVLIVEVDDDGVGLPAAIRPGLGLRSIRERAAELGGSALVAASPLGGVAVRARLPLAKGESA